MSEIIVVDEDGRVLKKEKEEGIWMGMSETRLMLYKGKPIVVNIKHMIGIKGIYKKVANDDIPEQDRKEIEKFLNRF